jgi:hypothetical protein
MRNLDRMPPKEVRGGHCAHRDRGLGQTGQPQTRHATRRSVTTGRCFRPPSNATTNWSLAPGRPLMSVCGEAHGEARGQFSLGSHRGVRLAGCRPKYRSSGVAPPRSKTTRPARDLTCGDDSSRRCGEPPDRQARLATLFRHIPISHTCP